MSKPEGKTSIRVPANLQVFVEALGEDGAIDFLMQFGGAPLHIPKGTRGDTLVERAIGQTKTRALYAVRDRIPKRMPSGKAWIAACLQERGLSVAEIARTLKVSDVAVRKYKAARGRFTDSTKAREPKESPPDQLDLFGDID